MKLTKSQRHTAYIIMLTQYEDGDLKGFCRQTRDVFGWNDNIKSIGGTYKWALYNLKYLPELLSKKPKDADNLLWFKENRYGRTKRIELLKQCIEETY